MTKPSLSTAGFVGLVALGNLLLATLGFARELLLASSSGTSVNADAFVVSFFIPDFLGSQLLATALLATCVPMFSGMSPEEAPAVIGRALRQVLRLTVPCSMAIALMAPYLVGLVAPGLNSEGRHLATSLVPLTAPIAVAFPLASVMISGLQVRNRFGVAAMAPVVFNAILICGHLALHERLGVGSWAVGACVGSVAMVALLWVTVRGEYGTSECTSPGTSVLRLAGPLVLVAALSQAASLIEKLFSSSLPEGGIAGLGYAYKISQAPLWVGGAAIATVVFPKLAVAASEEEFARTLWTTLLATTCFLAPAAMLLFTTAEGTTRLVFAQGAFGHESVSLVSGALRGYAVGLVPQGALYIMARAAQALGAWRTLLQVSALGLVGVVAADFLLVRAWGTLGIALGTSIGSATSAVCLWALLLRSLKGRRLGGLA